MTNISRRDFMKASGLALLSPLAACAARPLAGVGKYAKLDQNLKLDEVTEKNSRFYIKGVGILGENFYHVRTNRLMGDALFKDSKSLEKVLYSVNEKDNIVGSTSIVSGEGGLYFIDHALDENGKMIDEVEINPMYKKAVMSLPKIIEQKGDWSLFNRIEEDSQFNMGVGYLSGKPYLAVRVEDKKKDSNEKSFYNFYLVPVKGMELEANKEGHLRIKNTDNIYRPKFAPWKIIEEMFEERKPKLSVKEQKITKKVLKQVGLPELKATGTENTNSQ